VEYWPLVKASTQVAQARHVHFRVRERLDQLSFYAAVGQPESPPR
jgi:hypothetical protein